jgi:hypothetical protein
VTVGVGRTVLRLGAGRTVLGRTGGSTALGTSCGGLMRLGGGRRPAEAATSGTSAP